MIGANNDKTWAVEVGQGLDAVRVALGDRDLESVVGKDLGRAGDQARVQECLHVSLVSGGEDVSLRTLGELRGKRLGTRVVEGCIDVKLRRDLVECRLKRGGREDCQGTYWSLTAGHQRAILMRPDTRRQRKECGQEGERSSHEAAPH